MTTAETNNLLTHEHEPSEDTVEEGLTAYNVTAEVGFESTRKWRHPGFIQLSGAFPIRRLAGTGVWRIIRKISLLFGCTWLAIWMFWPSGMFPSRQLPLAVRCSCRRGAAYDSFLK
jgi:hypothetical protein